jgi:hypothetical protein
VSRNQTSVYANSCQPSDFRTDRREDYRWQAIQARIPLPLGINFEAGRLRYPPDLVA